MIYRIESNNHFLAFVAKKNYSTILFCGTEESIQGLSNSSKIVNAHKIWISSLGGMEQYEKSPPDLIVVLDKYLFLKIDHIDVENTDIIIFTEESSNPFIVSIPKSGTNLIHKVVETLNFKVIGDGARDSYALLDEIGLGESRIHSYIPFNLFVSTFDSKKRTALSSHYLPLQFNTTSKDYGYSTNPYVEDHFKNWVETGTPPIIFNYRDPRDTLISLIFYIEENPTFTYWSSITADIIKEFASLPDKINYIVNYDPSFFNIYYRQHFWLLTHPKVCNVSYEKLVGVKGKSTTKEQYLCVSKIMVHLSVEGCPKEVARSIYSKQSRTFRKGTIGEWKSCFSEKNKEDFNLKYRDILDLYGYE